jgi:adenylyl cyclase-associated protein
MHSNVGDVCTVFNVESLLEHSLSLLGCGIASCDTIVSGHGGESPAVKAYDAYVKSAVVPLAQTCDSLDGLEKTGSLLLDAWEGVRLIIVLASRSKMPAESLGEAFGPYLTKTREAVKKMRDLRLKRDMDRHQKTLIEMVGALSWILFKPPQQLPAPYVKEALGSAEFWSNRIRKDFKGKDETQIAFCDNVKKALVELAKYIEEFHKAGLTFNPRGVSLAEAAIVLTDEVDKPAPAMHDGKSPVAKRHPTLKGTGTSSGNVGGLISELTGRKNADGSSAATGLRKVG